MASVDSRARTSVSAGSRAVTGGARRRWLGGVFGPWSEPTRKLAALCIRKLNPMSLELFSQDAIFSLPPGNMPVLVHADENCFSIRSVREIATGQRRLRLATLRPRFEWSAETRILDSYRSIA
jgi:hypothetical protein